MRTSGELRTQVVAGAMLYGMDPQTAAMNWRVHVQPSNVRVALTKVVALKSFDSPRSIRSFHLIHAPLLENFAAQQNQHRLGKTISRSMHHCNAGWTICSELVDCKTGIRGVCVSPCSPVHSLTYNSHQTTTFSTVSHRGRAIRTLSHVTPVDSVYRRKTQ